MTNKRDSKELISKGYRMLMHPGDIVWWVPIKEVKQGEFLKLSLDANEVWTRQEYDREAKRYSIHSEDDISKSRLIKGTRKVFIGFTY